MNFFFVSAQLSGFCERVTASGKGIMASKVGEPVPDFTFLGPEGTSVRLSDFPAPALLLIFLRHLA